MSRASHQKLKILYIMRLFFYRTDNENTITIPEIISELKSLGINAERKSVYDDIEALQLFGLDIVKRKTKTHDYFLASRDFEIPEIKLLIDSVSSSKFITAKKSEELVKKLENLTSKHQAKNLRRQVFTNGRIKTMNESIYYSVDTIHLAIAGNKQITFKYFDWSVDKKKVFRKDGQRYITNPIALTYDNENYYLISYNSERKSYVHYRVDRMSNIEMLENECIKPDQEFDLSDYLKPFFSMFGGELCDVSLEFDNSLINIIIDRFGKNTIIIKVDENHFIAKVKVAISPLFLSWIIGFGNKAKVISPNYVIEDVYKLAYESMKQHEK